MITPICLSHALEHTAIVRTDGHKGSDVRAFVSLAAPGIEGEGVGRGWEKKKKKRKQDSGVETTWKILQTTAWLTWKEQRFQ